jgi:hypothetical protein
MACTAGVAWCRGGATHCAVVAGAATPMASTRPAAALWWGGATACAAHSANHRMRPMRGVRVPTRLVHPRTQHLGARRCAAGASAAAAAAAEAATASDGSGSDAASGQQHPHELPVRVYIEHTDTYQVAEAYTRPLLDST